MTAPIVLVKVSPRRVSDGSSVDLRLAGGGGEKPYRYDGHPWRAGIKALPTIIASLGFSDGELNEGGIPRTLQIEWTAPSHEALSELAGYVWEDAPVEVRIGPEGAFPPIKLKGAVLSVSAGDSTLAIALADPAADMKKPLLVDRYAGTGDLEGPIEWEGLIKRRVWGRVWNLPGAPMDSANNIYVFADPHHPIQAFDAVRDKGAPAAQVTVLGWQGSRAATLAALRAANAPQGGGVACPSLAAVKWWTTPAGDLTADLRGEVGSGYVETAPEIAQRMVELSNGPAFENGTIAAAKATRPAPVGWVADSDTETLASMLNALLRSVSLLWNLSPTGTIALRKIEWGASVAIIKAHRVSRVRSHRPLATLKLGYQRNQLPMARSSLAAIVLYSDIAAAPQDLASLDGDAADKLAGVENNATVGADWQANLVNTPVELTDGRVADGLTASGDVVRTLPTSIANQVIAGGLIGSGALAYLDDVNLSLVSDAGDFAALNDISLGDVRITDRTANFISETSTLRWAGQTGADVTSGAIAAGFSGSGGLAYRNDIDLSFVTNAGDFAGLNSIGLNDSRITNRTAQYITETSSRKWAGQTGADVTIGNIAAGFTGSGAFAYLNDLDLGDLTKITGELSPARASPSLRNDTLFQQQPSLLPNSNFLTLDAEGKPAGIMPVEGTGSRAQLEQRASTGGMRIKGSPDQNVAFGFPAMPVDDRVLYTFRIRHFSSAASASGLFLRLNELNGVLGGSRTHVAQSGANAWQAARTSFVGLLTNGPMPGSFREDTYSYRPTKGTKFASFSMYNWSGFTGDYEVAWVSLQASGPAVLSELDATASLGVRGVTDLVPAYTVGGSNVTVSLPAHVREVVGRDGKTTVNYGATSFARSFGASWHAYVTDPNLLGSGSPPVTVTANADDLAFPGRVHLASGKAPNSAGNGGSAGPGGGSNGGTGSGDTQVIT